MTEVSIIIRTFQAGTGSGGKEFDADYFSENVARPIRNLLAGSEKIVGGIIIVVNAEKGNPLAESIYSNGQTPSSSALVETFPEEIKSGRVLVHLCHNWGNNPGSGNALNEGIEIASKLGADLAMCWSPEIEMNGYQISEALNFMEERNLSVVGFLRENWWQKPQWHISQNTAAIWDIKTLQSARGFSPECNGTGKTIMTEEFGEVSLAGMEDFHTMLKILKSNPSFRWGMTRRSNPLKWDTNFPPNSERLLNHLKKVARQEIVMSEWSKLVFPYLSYNQVMDNLFARYHQD